MRNTHRMQCGEFVQSIVVEKRTDGLYWAFDGWDLDAAGTWSGPSQNMRKLKKRVNEFGEAGPR